MFECPLCTARYASQWAVEECRREDETADRDARRR